MIRVARARTAGTVGRELMDTWYGSREVASKRREIHCRPSVELIYLRGKKTCEPLERNRRLARLARDARLLQEGTRFYGARGEG